jgi:hypothetical protein
MPACARVSCEVAIPDSDSQAGLVLRKSASITIPESVLQRSLLLSEQLKLCGSVRLPVADDAAKEWIRLSKRLSLRRNEPSALLLKPCLQKACSLLEVWFVFLCSWLWRGARYLGVIVDTPRTGVTSMRSSDKQKKRKQKKEKKGPSTLQKVLGRTFVMVQLCHSNDFGSLWLCCQFAIRVLALLFAFQLVRICIRAGGNISSRRNRCRMLVQNYRHEADAGSA